MLGVRVDVLESASGVCFCDGLIILSCLLLLQEYVRCASM